MGLLRSHLEGVVVEVEYFLWEFPNIMLDNVLDGLVLVKNISHNMDLILGDSFPNKAAHRMAPDESKEFNK